MNRRQGVVTAVATLAALAVVPIASAVADTTPKPPSNRGVAAGTDAPAPLLAAMRRDLGLTDDQARTRLTREAAAPVVERQLRQRLGTTFAGAWFDTATNGLVVAITDGASADQVTAAGATPKVVARSERDLDTVKTKLDQNASRAGRNVFSWYVDPVGNTVVVSAAQSATADAERFIKAAGAPSAAVRVVTTTSEAPRPVYDLRGGDAYGINNTARCSIGFSVAGGFVTAGHCGGAGSTTTGSNGVGQGTVQGSTFPGNDYAWVQVNSNWTPQPWVNDYAGGNVPVAGSQEAAIGSSICRSGSTTGWHCGAVQAKNVTVTYDVGNVVGLTQTSVCAEPGDSGGSFISGDQAQGVTSGKTGDCTSGGNTWYQPVNPILSRYGLSLTTTGGSTSRIVSNWNNKCIDVPNWNFTDGQRLIVWDCTGGTNQNWTFVNGTVRTENNMCMDVAWGSVDNGAAIQIASCSGNPAQQFVLSAAGDLVNPQSNKCVDIADWNPNNDAVLQQWECGGTANQKWRRG